MTEPLSITFDVDCSPEHAFDVWTSRIDTWWPRDHTVRQAVAVVLQRHLGGRIYERDADGVEHDWGEITAWEPPSRLAYSWHIGRSAGEATDVEIRFVAGDPGRRGSRSTRAVGNGSVRNPGRGATETGSAGTPCSPTSRKRSRGTTDGCRHEGRPLGSHDPARVVGVHDVSRR